MRLYVRPVVTAIVSLGLCSAASPAEPGKQLSIYFYPQSSKITPAGDDAAAAIVLYTDDHHSAGIELVGHADTSEKNPKNLSLKRAAAVAVALKRHKLSASVRLSVEGTGAYDLAIPTEANVAEPLNRFVRVTIR